MQVGSKVPSCTRFLSSQVCFQEGHTLETQGGDRSRSHLSVGAPWSLGWAISCFPVSSQLSSPRLLLETLLARSHPSFKDPLVYPSPWTGYQCPQVPAVVPCTWQAAGSVWMRTPLFYLLSPTHTRVRAYTLSSRGFVYGACTRACSLTKLQAPEGKPVTHAPICLLQQQVRSHCQTISPVPTLCARQLGAAIIIVAHKCRVRDEVSG